VNSNIEVKCPHCKREQFMYLGDFKRKGNKFSIKEECNNCGNDFKIEFELDIIKEKSQETKIISFAV